MNIPHATPYTAVRTELLPDYDPLPGSAEYYKLAGALGAAGMVAVEKVFREHELVSSWESAGYVKDPPQLADQIQDETRVASIRYAPSLPFPKWKPEDGVVTESDGLRELDSLLTNFIEQNAASRNPKDQDRVARAVDFRENATFIGNREYQEAVRGIGTVWRAYLDTDPRRKLCIVTELNQLGRYAGMRKSDEFMKDQVLAQFTDAELAKYSGRIVDRLEDMDADPANGKVVLLEDWTVSGRQMAESYRRLEDSSEVFQQFAAAGNVEANLITASEDRIRNGLMIDPADPARGSIPVKAYYKAHHAPTARSTGYSYISGAHSSVNYGFGGVCDMLVSKTQRLKYGVPMLANIVKGYHDQVPSIRITGDSLERVPAIEVAYDRAVVLAGAVAVGQEIPVVA